MLVDFWIHYAELVLGGARGHSALANTSIPLGAFCALFAVVLLNQGLRRSAPRLALSPAEVLRQAPVSQAPNGICYATIGQITLAATDLERMIATVPRAAAAPARRPRRAL